MKEELEKVFGNTVVDHMAANFPMSSIALGCSADGIVYYAEAFDTVIYYNGRSV